MLVGYQEITLLPGEFIFGRHKAAKELRLTERCVRTCLQTLEKCQNVTIKTTNKFSIVSIINWSSYQGDEISNDHQNDQQVTNKRPASDQQLTTNKNDKNDKNDKNTPPTPPQKKGGVFSFDELSKNYPWLDCELWDDFRLHRQKLRAPLTKRAENLLLEKLDKLNPSTDKNGFIKKSIECGWKGIFLNDGQTKEKPPNNGKYSHLG